MMIRILALLCLSFGASSAFFKEKEPQESGLSQIFSVIPFEWGKSSFIKLPRSQVDATNEGWEQTVGPTFRTGYRDLILFVNPSDPTTGLYFDDEGRLCGMVIAIPVDEVKPYYDIIEQGFTQWTYESNGIKTSLYASAIYFVPEDKEDRVFDASQVLQAANLVFRSLNGTLDVISTNVTEINSVWTIQDCVPFMGTHFYYNMSTSTSCDKPFIPYFGLYDMDTYQLIGVGMMLLGKCTTETFENPDVNAVKFMVNHGPQCLYDLVDEFAATMRHIFYTDNPKRMRDACWEE